MLVYIDKNVLWIGNDKITENMSGHNTLQLALKQIL